MRRLFWLGVGAAAGYYAARRGDRLVQDARERGLVGNVTLAATTATKVASSATRTAVSIGEAAGSRVRTGAATPEAGPVAAAPEPTADAPPTPSTRDATS